MRESLESLHARPLPSELSESWRFKNEGSGHAIQIARGGRGLQFVPTNYKPVAGFV